MGRTKNRLPFKSQTNFREFVVNGKQLTKTSVSHFKVKNTPVKDTDEKGKFKVFLQWTKKAFLHQIVLRDNCWLRFSGVCSKLVNQLTAVTS